MKHSSRVRHFAQHPGQSSSSRALAMFDANTTHRQSRTSIASECGPVIYAVRLDDGTIKIGWSSQIAQRVAQLGCGFDGVLALIPGTREDEARVHAGLVAHRARGREYYHPTPDVLRVVNDMRAVYGFEPLAT